MTTPDAQMSLLHRRRFLALAGVGGAAVVLAACGGDDDESSDETTTTTEATTTTTAATSTTSGSEPADDGSAADLEIAMLAAGLEVLAVDTYTAAGEAAASGALGEVPPAVATYVETELAHHQAHLDSWNGIITGSGEAEVTEPNADLAPTVEEGLSAATDVPAVARLALMLEGIAAATYLDAVSMLANGEIIEQAGSMQVIDRQHMSLLHFALGEYPVPEVFATTDESAAG
jgi:hypothetical protein